MDIAVNPTLVLALGGTGQNILNRLRRRIRQRLGTDRLPLVEYVYVDTDQGNKDAGEATGDGIPIGLSPQVAADLADLQGRAALELDLASWLSEDALDRLRRGTLGGAQGFRQLGRVSFLASQKLRELSTQLRERVGNLLEARQEHLHKELPNLQPKYLRHRLQGAGPKVFLYVLASAGGGTGSSCLIDVGYFVRRALRESGYEADVRLIGVALLASSAFEEQHQYRYNSGGVLTELNHYLRRPAYKAAYPLAFPGDPLRPDLPRGDRLFGVATMLPFDYQYVVQPATMHGGSLDPDNPPRAMAHLEQKVAEMILADTLFAAAPGAMEYDRASVPPSPPAVVQRVLKGELESRRIDFAGRARKVNYDGRYPTDLLTFGVSCYEFPAALHHVLAFGTAVRELAGRWSSSPRRDPNAGPDDLGQPLANLRLRTWMDRLTLLADEREYAEQRSREAGGDQLLRALLELPDSDPRQQLLAAATLQAAGQETRPEAWLQSRRGAVDSLLVEVADTPLPGQPGAVAARLRDRRQQLAGWSPAGLPYQVAKDLLDLAFDADAGPGAALVLAERLAARLRLELDWVRLCQQDPAAPTPAVVRAAEQRRDWLLVGWHHHVGAPPDTGGVAAEAWQHANQRLLRLVLQGKAAVLEGCLAAVERLRPRLRNLRDWLAAWPARLPDPNDPDYQINGEEAGYVLRDEALLAQFARLDGLADGLRQALGQVPLYRQLLDDIAHGLPSTAADGGPALLLEGPPLDRRRNQPDFSALEAIEAAVFEAIGARRDGPYQQEVIELLNRRAAAAGTALPNLQAEASPLLQFEANNTGYAMDCRFGGDVELWQLLAAADSLGYEQFEQTITRQQGGVRFPDTPETKMQQVDTMIPAVVTVLRHRIGIVSPLINGYDEGTVRRLLRNAAHPALTDTRIRPPLEPNLLWECGFKILGGLILGHQVVFDVEDQRFLFSYNVRDKAGFSRTQKLTLPMEFDAAYEQLALADQDLAELDARLRLKVYELGEGVTARLEEVIAQIDRARTSNSPDCLAQRLDVWSRDGQASGVLLTRLPYEDALSLLTSFALEYGIRCRIEFQHHYADFKRAGDTIVGGVAQTDGWFCRFCGVYHGGTVPAGNRTCSQCRNLQATAR
ncbi:MAG: hypothetical protein IT204_11490 [Fimbriimonadaceae bacterium]|nr:hypothetical protein [Fimbriimonadaceae bacterium]